MGCAHRCDFQRFARRLAVFAENGRRRRRLGVGTRPPPRHSDFHPTSDWLPHCYTPHGWSSAGRMPGAAKELAEGTFGHPRPRSLRCDGSTVETPTRGQTLATCHSPPKRDDGGGSDYGPPGTWLPSKPAHLRTSARKGATARRAWREGREELGLSRKVNRRAGKLSRVHFPLHYGKTVCINPYTAHRKNLPN